MIIDSTDYKRNRVGEISHRQRIKLACDRCGKTKETLYCDYKRRLHKTHDYCKTCSNILGITGCKGRKSGYRTKIEVSCKQCGKKIRRYPSYIKKYTNMFCSGTCSGEYGYQEKYGYLIKNAKKHINEMCYLMGVILGDGTITNIARKTKRIAIFSNSNDTDVMTTLKHILKNIHVKYTVYDHIHSKGKDTHCTAINFSLPNAILSMFGMLFYGDKFKVQPSPNKKCTDNINFAIGLFNSDGYFIQRGRGQKVLSFSNTVRSIVDALKECLRKNSIYCKERSRKAVEGYKQGYNVWLERQKEIDKLIRMSHFDLKTIRAVK